MIKKISNLAWALKTAFTACPLAIILEFFIAAARTTVGILITQYIGRLVDAISLAISGQSDISDLFVEIVFFCILLIVAFTLMYINGFIVNKVIPMRSNYKFNRMIIAIVQNIPAINFDRNEFHDEFVVVKKCILSLSVFISSVIDLVTVFYGFIYSMILLLQIHYIFPIIAFVTMLIGILIDLKVTKVNWDIYSQIRQEERRERYYEKLFTDYSTAKEIRVLDLSAYILERWAQKSDMIADIQATRARKIDWKFASYKLFNDFVNVCVLVLGFVMARNGSITAGMILVVWRLVGGLIDNAQGIQRGINSVLLDNKRVELARQYCTQYLENPVRIRELPPAPMVGEGICLDNVSFSYRPDVKAVNGVSLHIRQGETIALCGENGSGKSTLVKLILGIYPPDEGSVYVCGYDVKNVSDSYVTKNIGFIFQDYVKYPLTLRENVGFGNIDKMSNDPMLVRAIESGDAMDVYIKVNHNLNAMLGRKMSDDGFELSEGQWQRVALARTYMSEAGIMIFDEPAAKLDPLAEKRQFDGMYAQLNGRTGILISHRIGFAQMASRIIVMDKGQIAEDGTHDELMKAGGIYSRLFREQAKWYDPDLCGEEMGAL